MTCVPPPFARLGGRLAISMRTPEVRLRQLLTTRPAYPGALSPGGGLWSSFRGGDPPQDYGASGSSRRANSAVPAAIRHSRDGSSALSGSFNRVRRLGAGGRGRFRNGVRGGLGPGGRLRVYRASTARSRRGSKRSAARASPSFMRWEYTRSVTLGSAWPATRASSRMFAPCAISCDTAKWRRS
jgi:hypothetical protein